MIMDDQTFAVVDVETTGISPRYGHRVVEIAVVRVDARGTELGRYETLVNPGRDVGPTYIHGIRDDDVAEAPRFEDVAGDVYDALNGAVFVAHNARFDLSFVRAELQLAGCPLPAVPYLCTVSLSRRVERLPSHRLGEVCRHYGVGNSLSHSAAGDAEATATILTICLGRLRERGVTKWADFGGKGSWEEALPWPVPTRTGRAWRRADARSAMVTCRVEAPRIRPAEASLV
jgi:ATP-dependent helicase Lhr and Lhr-like helicase